MSTLDSGRKRPSPAMSERLDEVLGAENALVSLVPAPPASVHPQAETANPAPWVYEFGRDVSAATRRQFTAAFLAALGIAVPARRLTGGFPAGGQPFGPLGGGLGWAVPA